MSHWSSANTNNRARLARALATDTGVGYQKCLRVVTGVADAGLLPPFDADTTDATVRALAPLVLVQSVKGKPSKAGKAKQGFVKPSWGTAKAPASVFAEADESLVSFSPHAVIAANRAPGVAITGAPGAGKSFWAFSLARQMTAEGARVVYIDPKADAMPLARVRGLEGTKVLHLRNGEDGMLNPFTLTEDPRQGALLALEVVRMLLGGSMFPEREEVLIRALNVVSDAPNPSLGSVVDVLLAYAASAEARSLGLTLDIMQKLPHAGLLFGERTGLHADLGDALTIITALGLDLPSGDLSPDDYSYENRLGMSVMYLTTAYARHQLMSFADQSQPKAVILDEAWTVTSTLPGARLISQFGRMGRSSNTALVLVTQNAEHLTQQRVSDMISTVFGFRTNNPHEVDSLLRLLGAEAHETHRSVVANLLNGECLMRDDIDGMHTRVQVSPIDDDLMAAFSGNP